MKFRPRDSFGVQRVKQPVGVLPQQAESLDPALPIAEDEVLIEVESLNIDSASFHQIAGVCLGDPVKIQKHIVELVAKRGKQHNPVTGSGGMLIGRVAQVGPAFPTSIKPIAVGDRIATLVSLSLTPLEIRKIKKVHLDMDRVDIDGHAILFSSGIFAKLPADLPEAVALAVLDVAGAPAQTRKLVQPNQTVVVVGGGGKSGLLCLYEAKKKPGVRTIALDYSKDAIEQLKKFPFVDEIIQLDARNAVLVFEKVKAATAGKMADIVINVANVPETEIASILCAKNKGIVYFFSMATNFTRAALGAEGLGADVDLRIGNGYTEGHAELALSLLRESPELMQYFKKNFN